MGLGGALLAQTRRLPPAPGALGGVLADMYAALAGTRDALHTMQRLHVHLADHRERVITQLGARDGIPPDPPRGPVWLPAYTHPVPPAPGFAVDFAPEAPEGSRGDPMMIEDEDAGPPTLVCARCAAPMELDAGGEKDEAPRAEKRLWALRCGHIVDGRCLEVLMQPVMEARVINDSKGKRRAVPGEGESGPSPKRRQAHSADGPSPRGPSLTSTRARHTDDALDMDRLLALSEHSWRCPVAGCGRVHVSRCRFGQWKHVEDKGAIAMYV